MGVGILIMFVSLVLGILISPGIGETDEDMREITRKEFHGN